MIDLDELELIEPYEQTAEEEEPQLTFAQLGVPGPLVHVLNNDHKTTAFPIQADTLPDSLEGRDILGRGRTGSGKTLAFSIPMISRLGEVDFTDGMSYNQFRKQVRNIQHKHLYERQQDDFTPHPRGLVLAPTRELANQINDVLAPLADVYGMSTTTVYGGVKYIHQIRDLRAGADIVVACPGRLEDLIEQGVLTLAGVKVVVIDEADEMADMGFLEPIQRILRQIPDSAQHMLFSATLDHGVDKVVQEFLHDPKEHAVDEATSAVDLMTHHVFEVKRADKPALIRKLASGKGRRILFTRTKFQTKKLAKELTQHGIPAAELDGNLSQNQRDRNLQAFESGEVNVLVATDVAARGIDVSNVELVVQVDPPQDSKSFLHRSGRTARAGKSGDVVTVMTPDQRRYVKHLVKRAGINWKPVKVTPEDELVLSLVGEEADPIMGWKLDTSKPLHGHGHGDSRSRDRKRSSRSRGRKDRGMDRMDRPGSPKKTKKKSKKNDKFADAKFQDTKFKDSKKRRDRYEDRDFDRRDHRDFDRNDRRDRNDFDRRDHKNRRNFDRRDRGERNDFDRNDRRDRNRSYGKQHDNGGKSHRNGHIGHQSRAHMRKNSTPFSKSRKRH